MRGRERLTVGALLDAQAALGAPRLVVLSACETGLFDLNKNPDEFVGLPATFMQLGAAGVVSSLWQVNDAATAFLMAKFYELHLDKGLPPPAALKQAKAWLRTATRRELLAFAKQAAKQAKAAQAKMPDLAESLGGGRGAHPGLAAVWDTLPDLEERRGNKPAGKNAKRRTADPDAKPFEHPYFWSGFVYTGA